MSWHELPMNLRHKASTPEASRATVAQAWTVDAAAAAAVF
jgi:hypothetical protein